MKKIIFLALFSLIFIVGCTNMANTPTKKTEELMSKYQKIDQDISSEITELVRNNEILTQAQQTKYKDLIERQYKNLTYNIKDEKINGDNAVVTVEIEVIDYKKVIAIHEEEYLAKTDYTNEEYNDAKIQRLESTKEKVKYTLEIDVKKVNDTWEVQPLSSGDIKKIQGMY